MNGSVRRGWKGAAERCRAHGSSVLRSSAAAGPGRGKVPEWKGAGHMDRAFFAPPLRQGLVESLQVGCLLRGLVPAPDPPHHPARRRRRMLGERRRDVLHPEPVPLDAQHSQELSRPHDLRRLAPAGEVIEADAEELPSPPEQLTRLVPRPLTLTSPLRLDPGDPPGFLRALTLRLGWPAEPPPGERPRSRPVHSASRTPGSCTGHLSGQGELGRKGVTGTIPSSCQQRSASLGARHAMLVAANPAPLCKVLFVDGLGA